MSELNYVILSPRVKITLNLFEAEWYESAIVVQPLIGNLVHYSNKGRYEPRLAKAWKRVSPTQWDFHLREGLACEDGEQITAEGFKTSIERSLRTLSESGGTPVLDRLQGFGEFLQGKQGVDGIRVQGSRLSFHFTRPIRSGVLQILSFAPFGYICRNNLNEDGSWKDNERFISSGPYQIETIQTGSRYVLTRQKNWALPFGNNSPVRVEISHQMPEKINLGENWIIDRANASDRIPDGLEPFPLVPEYLNSILLGNLNKGYFSNSNNRKKFKYLVGKYRDNLLPEKWESSVRGKTLYPSQAAGLLNLNLNEGSGEIETTPPTAQAIVIEGTEPPVNSHRGKAWVALRAALEEMGLKYRFHGNENPDPFSADPTFDLRIRGHSIGGGVEPWGLGILFGSPLGLRFPDPTGRILKMLEDYENDLISDDQLTHAFLKQVEEDSAILTISHFGVVLHLTPGIVKDSLSPTLSIVRFDQLEME